jgi:hypothetical protein
MARGAAPAGEVVGLNPNHAPLHGVPVLPISGGVELPKQRLGGIGGEKSSMEQCPLAEKNLAWAERVSKVT